jgi:hypothetical protein
MTSWPQGTFAAIDHTEELIVVVGISGNLAKRVPIWVVTVDGDVYVRSYKGVTSRWFQRVQAEPNQAVGLPDGDVNVVFENVDRTDPVNQAISQAFTAKYAKFDYVTAMSQPAAVEATLRILPR